MKKTPLAIGLAAAALIATPAHAGIIGYGGITDPTGDGGAYDLTSGFVSVDSSAVVKLSATFATGTSLSGAFVAFSFDMDQNPATGWPGVDSGHHDSALMGVEYVAYLHGSGFQAAGAVFGYNGTDWNLVLDMLPVTYSGTTMELTMALGDLSLIPDAVNFTVVSSQQFSEFSISGIQDHMPNLGSFGTVTIPEPGTLALFGIGALGLLARRRV